jgi:hypothetical protein
MFHVFRRSHKILKSVNALELIPVASVKHEVTDAKTVNLLIPRFSNKFLLKIFTGSRVGDSFKIILDETGSFVWLNIDGKKEVGGITKEVFEHYKTKNILIENAEERISQFITQLYQEGCITFKQLL